MRKKLEQLTEMDIRHFKQDIEKLQKQKKLFLKLGILFLILFLISLAGTILLAIGVYNSLHEGDYISAKFLFILFDSLVGSLTLIFLVISIVFFVLREALCGRKIEKRKRIIEDYEELYKEENK